MAGCRTSWYWLILFMHWDDGGLMERKRDLTLLSLLEWQDRQDRWEAIPEEARREFETELARLMVRAAVREQNDDRAHHC